MNYLKNYIGTEIGKFKILDQKREKGITYLFCRCMKCNKEKWIALKHIKNTKCCEAKKSKSNQFKPQIPKEKVINGITLLELTDIRKNSLAVWKCKCFCGNIFYAPLSKIKRREIKSCGCSNINYTPANLKKANKQFQEKYLKEGTSLSLISHKLISTNTSGHRGVVWDKARKKWIAQIEFKGKRYYLGRYDNLEDAIRAREKAEEKFFKPILEKYNKKTLDN